MLIQLIEPNTVRVDDAPDGTHIYRKFVLSGTLTDASPEPPTDTAPTAEDILDEAKRLTSTDRQGAYGHPAKDYDATGRIWAATLDRWLASEHPGLLPPGFRMPDIPAHIACLMMVGVKVSREAHHPKRDNRTDGVGYFRCADMALDEGRRGQ